MSGNWNSMGTSTTLDRFDGIPALGPPAVTAPRLDFDAAYREGFSFVWRTARRLGVEEDAIDDVCQEVFVIVYRQLAEFAGRSSFRTWLFGILHHVVQSHRRTLARKSPAHRARGDVVDPADVADTARISPHEQLAFAETVEVARELLAQLDDDKRTVLILADLEEMSVPDIAEALGLNINTVYGRLRAARVEFARGAQRHRTKDGWRTR